MYTTQTLGATALTNVNLLMNGKREIVDQHTSFSPGDEDQLFEKVKKVAAGQPLEK